MRILQSLWLTLLLYIAGVNAGLVDDIVNGLKNSATCAACHGLLVPLKLLARFGDRPFRKTFVAVCKVATSFDDDVCEGAVGTQAPILAHDLRSIDPLGQTAKKLCDALFGLCQPPAVNTYRVPFPRPLPINPKTFTSSGKAPFQVVHFSDIHIDRSYAPGSDSTCSKPICCRNYAGENQPPISPAGPMGSRNCDTPTGLAHNFLRTITNNNKFSIFTGDVIEASVWLANRDDVTHDIKLFTGEIATIPGAPVYAALGNHESAPTNAFPRNTTKKSNSQWVFDSLSEGWKPIIGPVAAQQAAHLSGSYSIVVPGTNLRIISLNTVYWYKNNWWLYDSNNAQPDPNGILQFTVEQLQVAEDAGHRAWIVGHIPPGRQDVLRDQSNYFDQIVQRYRHVIAGQFFGHSHQDEFMVGYSDYNRRTSETAVSVAMLAPAITPRGSNPGFKVYDIDPDTYEVMDVKVYRSDLFSPEFQVEPKWELGYSARDLYGRHVSGLQPHESLGPVFWHKVTEAFERDNGVFDTYRSLKRGGGDPGTCDAECKRIAICDIRAMRSENSCTVSKPGIKLRRGLSEDGTDQAHDLLPQEDCEGPGVIELLQVATHDLSDDGWERLRTELEAIIPEGQPTDDPDNREDD
ncbi:sphingomyelin phosphodiesterase [Coprinopsis marcescibilis]|uniref:Sphingomyelin phosphodiesterase n=1 Tax=Coprinopsis marcescibilis TaxID=230819 RepID=A0A5C3L2Q7_COPMA|nr:sphingomyelin phosphodiesterase [Coprinopsis marcescibilis]